MRVLKKIINCLKFRSRLYVVYSYEPDNKVAERDPCESRLLNQMYKIKIIQTVTDFLEVDCSEGSIIGSDTITHFKECLKNGGYVYFVFHNSELIFRSCVQKGPYESHVLGKSYLRIPGNAYYIEYVETHPHYRRQGIYQSLLIEMCKRLPGKIYIATDAENIASQKGIEKAGFVIKEMSGIIQLPFLTRVMNKVNYFGDTLLAAN